jgi:glycine/sarcosine N-methyltransferase
MDRTTEHEEGAEVFYDACAGDYDRMTGFDRRFVAERPFFTRIVDRFAIGSALDAGAGTGFHSLLLSELGVRVTALDLSAAMLDRLASHARERAMVIETSRSDFQSLPQEWSGRFDAVFCLGNSLPHLLSAEELTQALGEFRRVLRPRGTLFAQLLNYERILASRERVVGVKKDGGTTFVRFYDFAGELVQFNILRLQEREGGMDHRLDTVTLRPWRSGELATALHGAGFARVQQYGNMAMEPYDGSGSRDLVAVAFAGEENDITSEA